VKDTVPIIRFFAPMRNWLIAGLLTLGFTHSNAQNLNLAEKGCATVTTPQEMQLVAKYLAHPIPKAKTTSGPDSIPLSLHIVAMNNGSGRYRLDYLLKVICELNTRYAPVGFYYFIKWPIHYINNTNFYDHDYWNGAMMMQQNNVPNTANVYFVDDPAGACGYFSPSEDGVAIAKSCSGPSSTTLTHELGHYFGLPHTFFGWENGATPFNPELVTRGAGANCSTTGDFFCDTDADYLGDRWSCPYTGHKADANGDLYHPDSSLYMSYATDNCMSRFSNQQMSVMNSRLTSDRTNLLTVHPTGNATLNSANIIQPGNVMYANNKTVVWDKVTGADAYYVKYGWASVITKDTIVSDTSYTIQGALTNNSQYYVSVVPLSSVNVCMSNPQKITFTYNNTVNSIGGPSFTENRISISPNPANAQVTVKFDVAANENCQLQLFDISGRQVFSASGFKSEQSETMIQVDQFPAGIYLIKLSSELGTWTNKLVIQH